mgnify:CR=1 FL=1
MSECGSEAWALVNMRRLSARTRPTILSNALGTAWEALRLRLAARVRHRQYVISDKPMTEKQWIKERAVYCRGFRFE